MRLVTLTRWLVLFFVAFIATAPSHAKVRDKRPPHIDHTPIETAQVGENIEVRVVIKDKSGVFDPTLYYRSVGAEGFLRATLVESDGYYTASIPSAALTADIEYFVEAYDELGNGPARVGSPEQPLHIVVRQASTSTTADNSNANTTLPSGNETHTDATHPGVNADATAPGQDPVSAEPDDDIMYGVIGGAVGAALLLAAGTAVVVYMVFIRPSDPPDRVTLEVSAPPITQMWGTP